MGKILYQRCKVRMKGTSSKMGAAAKELEKTVNMLKACEDFFSLLFRVKPAGTWDSSAGCDWLTARWNDGARIMKWPL